MSSHLKNTDNSDIEEMTDSEKDESLIDNEISEREKEEIKENIKQEKKQKDKEIIEFESEENLLKNLVEKISNVIQEFLITDSYIKNQNGKKFKI